MLYTYKLKMSWSGLMQLKLCLFQFLIWYYFYFITFHVIYEKICWSEIIHLSTSISYHTVEGAGKPKKSDPERVKESLNVTWKSVWTLRKSVWKLHVHNCVEQTSGSEEFPCICGSSSCRKQRLLAASWRKSDSHKNALLLCSSLAS